MATIKVKEVRATMTKDEREPHYMALVDYGLFQFEIPLPGRNLLGDEWPDVIVESTEAMEALAHALLEFAQENRRKRPHLFS